MKQTIIILITVLTLSVAGVLYGYHLQTDGRYDVSLEETYTSQFPEQMPDVVMDPMVSFSVY